MYFGADYHPELWVYPYAGSEEEREKRWEEDARLMAEAGINAVRMGEFCWALYEPQEGQYDFDWMRRAMDVMHQHGLKVVLATPTASPPLWLLHKHPEILPVDENGLRRYPGTRHAYCMNSDVYWEYVRKIVQALAEALGQHPALIAWQIDSGVGDHQTESSFNEESRHDWHAWLKVKYGTVERLNELLGLRFWGQVVDRFEQVPMPMRAPTAHNPALVLDWMRFSSDTCVAFVRMQVEILRRVTPNLPVTTNLKPFGRKFDHFDMAEVLDFVSLISHPTLRHQPYENAVEHDLMRSLKKGGIRTPDGDNGFWVIEQKAGNVSWQDVNSPLRPGVVRLFTYQAISRGATGIFYFYWRSPRVGSEKFYGGVLNHKGSKDNRVYREISQIGEELKLLHPILEGSVVEPEAAILYTYDNEWAMEYPVQPNRHFKLRDHVMLFYNRRSFPLQSRDRPFFTSAGGSGSGLFKVICPERRSLSGNL